MMRWAMMLASGLAIGGSVAAKPMAEGYQLIPGSVPLDFRGPDGNSIFLDAPDGLILVDTGRHPPHAEKLVAFSRERGRPIAAIINTHWHLDHTTGNLDIRQAFPSAHVYATPAIERALKGFLGRNRPQVDEMLADPKVPTEQKAQMLRGRYRVDHPDTLRPTVPVTASGRMKIAGRNLDVRVSKFAATEADIWLYVPEERLAIVGDLVVDIVPFMDTACPDGWKRALDEVAATPFVTLIPGHGEPMNRSQFLQWRLAFENFVECGRSDRSKVECVAGWKRDAAPFIDAEHSGYAGEVASYYIDTRLRSSRQEQQKYCRPLGA
jgi:glyoxylase-like metal-dependent hydrolase (beta-lactamase superfamily II)